MQERSGDDLCERKESFRERKKVIKREGKEFHGGGEGLVVL